MKRAICWCMLVVFCFSSGLAQQSLTPTSGAGVKASVPALANFNGLARAQKKTAGAPATVVVNQNDPTRHVYQWYTATNCNPEGCALAFPAITTGRTIIKHVSCTFNMATSGILFRVSLTENINGFTGDINNFLPVFPYGTWNNATYYGINADTYLSFTKGQTPVVYLYSLYAGPQGFSCTLTGYFN
jgi:hypothetical protein